MGLATQKTTMNSQSIQPR